MELVYGNARLPQVGERTAFEEMHTPLVPPWLGTLPVGLSTQRHCIAPSTTNTVTI